MNMPVRQASAPVRLTLFRRWLIYGVGVGVWTTGIAWLVFHYFFMRQTEFGPAPTPMEPWALAIHAAFGFATVWLAGLLWGIHVTGGWRMRRHRISGATLLTVLGWLILSGYLLYYIGSDHLRSLVSLAHWIVGLTLPVPFFVHWLVRRR